MLVPDDVEQHDLVVHVVGRGRPVKPACRVRGIPGGRLLKTVLATRRFNHVGAMERRESRPRELQPGLKLPKEAHVQFSRERCRNPLVRPLIFRATGAKSLLHELP